MIIFKLGMVGMDFIDAVLCSLHCPLPCGPYFVLLPMMFTLITWLGLCLSGFSIIKSRGFPL